MRTLTSALGFVLVALAAATPAAAQPPAPAFSQGVAPLFYENCGAPPAHDVRADVAHDLRRGAAMGAQHPSTGRRSEHAAVER